jgi:hypothetical protein
MDGLFAALEKAKLQRFDLTAPATAVFDVATRTACAMYNDKLPADRPRGATRHPLPCRATRSPWAKALTREDRLLIVRRPAALSVATT